MCRFSEKRTHPHCTYNLLSALCPKCLPKNDTVRSYVLRLLFLKTYTGWTYALFSALSAKLQTALTRRYVSFLLKNSPPR
jgi:hypothetical protein